MKLMTKVTTTTIMTKMITTMMKDYANSYSDDDNHNNGADLLGPASCPPGSRGGGELMAFLKNRASL